MGIKTQKVLRFISKTVLLVVGLVLIGYVGLVVYKSIVNKPQKVRVTNVTNSAATITWVTDNPVRGVVYYNTKDSVLPGPLGFLFSNVAYDDRDFALAQKDCVNAFNENAKNTKDENFAVSGDNFDCENIKVEKLGAYYTHSVTLKNLDESGKYFFKVGNGILSWGINGVGKDINENDLPLATKFELSTGVVPTTIPTPNIAYGNVYAAEMIDDQVIAESQSKDSLVFAYLTIGGVNSQPVSAVTNDEGGWILDKSNFRDTEGNLITDLSSASMVVCSQYEHTDPKVCLEVLEDLDKDTNVDLLGNIVDDLGTYEKNKILEKFEQLVGKVYAFNPDPDKYSSCDQIGVDGCNGNSSKCTYKCYILYSTSFDWKTGNATVGNGGCSLPYSCGCEPRNDCDPRCSNGSAQHRTCSDTGGYNAWTGWSAGKCEGEADPCDDGSCTDGNITTPNGSQCPDGAGRCTNGTCIPATDPGDDDTDPKCVGKEDGDPCGVQGRYCDGGQCVGLGDGGDGGDEDTCTDGTPLGKCNSSGQSCHEDSNQSYYDPNCYCSGTGDPFVLPGQCTPGVLKKCVLNSNGTVSASGQSCTITIPPPETPCTATVTYYNPFYDSEGCAISWVKNCTLKCGDESKTISDRNACLSQMGFGEKKVCEGENDPGNVPKTIDLNEVDLSAFSETQLKQMMIEYSNLQDAVIRNLVSILKPYDNYDCNGNGLVFSGSSAAVGNKFCRALTGGNTSQVIKEPSEVCQGNGYRKQKQVCSPHYTNSLDLVSKTYAQDNSADGYTLYLPEYGMYSFELGDYNLTTESNSGNTYYIFYIESNEIDGFQMPADPDNPTAEEDIMLKSSSAQITYEKLSSAQKYAIVKGINLISFNFVPVSTELGAYTAADVISQATKNGVTIQYISTFDGGRWNNGYSCTSTPCTGNNFTIIPGKGYLVYATTGGNITIPGYNLTSSVPIPFSAGWNLVGVHGYTTAYTARSFIDSINTVKGLTANNVSWWPTSKSKYEGLQVDSGTEYGLDFPISPNNGYFVRISNFAPEDAKCKSLIWQIGGKLNGTCGNTK